MLEYTNILREKKGRSIKRGRDTLARKIEEYGERCGIPKSMVCIMVKFDVTSYLFQIFTAFSFYSVHQNDSLLQATSD